MTRRVRSNSEFRRDGRFRTRVVCENGENRIELRLANLLCNHRRLNRLRETKPIRNIIVKNGRAAIPIYHDVRSSSIFHSIP